MTDLLGLIVSTVQFRYYVFIFLLLFLVSASFKIGPKKALFFLVSGWFIAFVAEFSSVRNGIPFGLYHYIPSTQDKELWIWGIPFMDSLSFPFMAYASWTMARLFLSPYRGGGLFLKLGEPEWGGQVKSRFSVDVIFLGALLFMLLDVVVDPLALRGDRWFLGKIYYYPVPGPYFGVTLSNFAGWFVVGAAIMAVWRFIDAQIRTLLMLEDFPTVDLWGPALYYIILIFNISVTFWIGEYSLGWAGVFIFLPVTVLLLFKVFRGRL